MYRDFGVNPVNLTKPQEGRGNDSQSLWSTTAGEFWKVENAGSRLDDGRQRRLLPMEQRTHGGQEIRLGEMVTSQSA